MWSRRVPFNLLIPMLLAGATAAAAVPPPGFKGGVFEPPYQAPGFALRSSDGSELTLARFRGKVVLLSFGFTHCAAVCPTTLATLAEARQALGAAADAVQVVFVSVDPERDAPAQLKAYLSAFDPSFVGGTAEPEVLAAMRRRYGVVAEKVPVGSSYAVDHTSSIFLIDAQGRLRAMMPYGREALDLVHDIKLMLAE
jgi:protein SCO1/2